MPSDASHPSNKPLTRCSCGSRLVYPIAVLTACRGQAVVERRCPDCETRDTVMTSAEGAAAWMDHQSQLRAKLQAYLTATSPAPADGHAERRRRRFGAGGSPWT